MVAFGRAKVKVLQALTFPPKTMTATLTMAVIVDVILLNTTIMTETRKAAVGTSHRILRSRPCH